MAAVFRCLLLVFVSAAVHHRSEATRNSYDEALVTSYLQRAYRLSGIQAGGSSSAQSLGESSRSSVGGAAGSSNADTSSTAERLRAAYPLYSPGAPSSRTVGSARMGPLIFGCERCNEKFGSELDLYNHKRAHHPVEGNAHCYLCNFTYGYRRNYTAHLRNQHPTIAAAVLGASSGVTAGSSETGSSNFGCDKCNERFESELDLFDHKKAHHPVAGDAHCYLCNLTFGYKKNYIAHLRDKHPKIAAAAEKERQGIQASGGNTDIPRACPVCRKRYRSYRDLRDHYKNHTTDNTTCRLCDQVYPTRAIFEQHITDIHPIVKEPEPTEPFHGKKDIEKGPFVCEKCGNPYKYKRNLTAHMKSHETSETYCGYCKQRFASKHSYDGHMETHHPEDAQIEKVVDSVLRDEKKRVQCDQCDRGFKNAEGLRHHKKVHEGRTNCELCGAKFISRSAYYTHKANEHPKKN